MPIVFLISTAVSGKYFGGTCNFLTSHAIRHDQQNKKKAASHIHNANQLIGNSKKDAFKLVLALINELKSQTPSELDNEINQLPRTKTPMICKTCTDISRYLDESSIIGQKVVAKCPSLKISSFNNGCVSQLTTS